MSADPRRREPRIAATQQVWVAGRDLVGRSFRKSAKVLDVSPSGARLAEIGARARPGQMIELESQGQKTNFCIVWVSPDESEFGIRCSEPSRNFLLAAAALPESSPKQPTYEIFNYDAPKTSELKHQARKSPRFGCHGGVDVRNRVWHEPRRRIWATVSNLSLEGCFVSTPDPFEKETKVELLLGLCGHELRCRGTVCSSRANQGMSIVFTGMDEDNRRRLEVIIDGIRKVSFDGSRAAN